MHGIGDFMTYPEAQGVSPIQFIDQAVERGALPPSAPLVMEQMDESALFVKNAGQQPKAGQMAWESGPAPWDMSAGQPAAAAPPMTAQQRTPAVVQAKANAIGAQESKAVEAAAGAKVAADNALRAAKAGAPKVAATHAATAQAAANVAAQVANSPKAQRAAAVAQNEATKAVAAANVAAANGAASHGVGDFLELSGLSGLSGLEDPVVGGLRVKHVLYGALGLGLAYFGYKYMKSR